MASNPDSQPTQPSHLAQLRALAQQHLDEIEADKIQEQEQLTQADTDIRQFARMGSLDRKQLQPNMTIQPQLDQLSAQSSSEDGAPSKKERFRPFSDILHRLQWDDQLNIDDYIVGYLERFEGIKEMPAASWVRDFSEEEWIPMHRVRYVKRVRQSNTGDETQGPALGVVWDRGQRIDKIFGSGGQSEQAGDIMSVEDSSVTGGMAV